MISDMTQFIRKALLSIAPQIKKIADGDTILDCIQLTIAPGHTDGHLVSTIFSKNDKMLVIADVIHLDAILFQHPEWGISFDSNFELGITSRLRILNEASQTKCLIFGFHLPYPGVGHVKKIGNASYEYVPKAFFIND